MLSPLDVVSAFHNRFFLQWRFVEIIRSERVWWTETKIALPQDWDIMEPVEGRADDEETRTHWFGARFFTKQAALTHRSNTRTRRRDVSRFLRNQQVTLEPS